MVGFLLTWIDDHLVGLGFLFFKLTIDFRANCYQIWKLVWHCDRGNWFFVFTLILTIDGEYLFEFCFLFYLFWFSLIIGNLDYFFCIFLWNATKNSFLIGRSVRWNNWFDHLFWLIMLFILLLFLLLFNKFFLNTIFRLTPID